MRSAQEPTLFAKPEQVEARDGRFHLGFHLPQPGVSLILLTRKPDDPPTTPTGLRGVPHAGLTGEPAVMLAWQGTADRALRTYEVLHSPDGEGSYERVNQADVISSAFLHVGPGAGAGSYKVRAVDFWGRAGGESEPASL
jgi:hypothetical protein